MHALKARARTRTGVVAIIAGSIVLTSCGVQPPKSNARSTVIPAPSTPPATTGIEPVSDEDLFLINQRLERAINLEGDLAASMLPREALTDRLETRKRALKRQRDRIEGLPVCRAAASDRRLNCATDLTQGLVDDPAMERWVITG
jgi:hypothetical protein